MKDRGDPVRPDEAHRVPAPYGNVGQDDPHADPLTQPALLPTDRRPGPHDDQERTVDLRVGGAAVDPPTARITRATPKSPAPPTASPGLPAGRTRFSGLYVGLVLAALVLIFLLVFILQNLVLVRIEFLGFAGEVPLGVSLLLAAIAGVLLVAIPGTGRILQLRRAARRGDRDR
jgi:uncharacterized integral membrane protein